MAQCSSPFELSEGEPEMEKPGCLPEWWRPNFFSGKRAVTSPLAVVRRTRATPVATTTSAMAGLKSPCSSSHKEPVTCGRRESEPRPHPPFRGRGHGGGGGIEGVQR